MKFTLSIILIYTYFYGYLYANDSVRENYVQPINTTYTIKAITGYNDLLFSIKGKQKINYQSQKNFKTGLGFTYKKIGINLLTNILPTTDTTFSSSTNFDLRASVYLNKLTFIGNFHSFNGFYAPNLSNSTTVKKPGIGYLYTDINILYSFSNHVSYKAAFVQSEKQVMSAGSVVTMVNLSFSRINNRTNGLVPENEYFKFGDESKLKKGSFSSLSVMGGYAYTYTHSNFWVTNILIAGAGTQYQVYYLDVVKNNLLSPLIKGYYKMSIGYSKTKWFICFNGNADYTQSKLRKATFFTFLYSGYGTVGFRF